MRTGELSPAGETGGCDGLGRALRLLQGPPASIPELCAAFAGVPEFPTARRLIAAELGMRAAALDSLERVLLLSGPWSLLRACAEVRVASDSNRRDRIAGAIGCRELGRYLGLHAMPELYLASLTQQVPGRLCKQTFEALESVACRFTRCGDLGRSRRSLAELRIPRCAVRALWNRIQLQTDRTLQRLDEVLTP